LHSLQQRAVELFMEFKEEGVLAAEVVIDEPPRDASASGHFFQAGLAVALVAEDCKRSIE
jgi:uncharacterized protein YoaH (UPF0181 family)